jgi:2-polyprenyl-3-methyl-5-hydroxy-6-metoxy-1,4-benzoquinol methylase
MSAAQARCPACQSRVWVEIAPDDRSFQLDRCTGCGCYRITANQAVAPPELYRRYYDGPDARRLVGIFDRVWRNRRQHKATRILHGLPPGVRVCDVGCERGELLHVLAQAGCRVVGTQLSQAAADYAHDRFGIEVFVGELQDAPYEAGTFDLMLMINVLEHLPNPESYLEQVATLLRPGGTFWLEVPNAGSLTARLTGKRWLHHDPEHHLWSFTTGCLGAMVDRAGFTIERSFHLSWEHGPIGCLQSWLNFVPGPRNVIFDIVRGGLARTPGRLALQAVHIALAGVLLPAALLVSTLESLRGNGQVMLLRLRRR